MHFQYHGDRLVPFNQRLTFAKKLSDHILKGNHVVYMDEASVHMWLRQTRTWCTRENPILTPLQRNRGKGCTMMLGIGTCLARPVWHIADSTNKKDFVRFISKLREQLAINRYDTIYLCLDNASAHNCPYSLKHMKARNIEPLFQPPYSP